MSRDVTIITAIHAARAPWARGMGTGTGTQTLQSLKNRGQNLSQPQNPALPLVTPRDVIVISRDQTWLAGNSWGLLTPSSLLLVALRDMCCFGVDRCPVLLLIAQLLFSSSHKNGLLRGFEIVLRKVVSDLARECPRRRAVLWEGDAGGGGRYTSDPEEWGPGSGVAETGFGVAGAGSDVTRGDGLCRWSQ